MGGTQTAGGCAYAMMFQFSDAQAFSLEVISRSDGSTMTYGNARSAGSGAVRDSTGKRRRLGIVSRQVQSAASMPESMERSIAAAGGTGSVVGASEGALASAQGSGVVVRDACVRFCSRYRGVQANIYYVTLCRRSRVSRTQIYPYWAPSRVRVYY